MATVIYVMGVIGNFHISIPLAGRIGAAHTSDSLKIFALVFLAVGLWQRHKRWRELLGGVAWHTLSFRVSYLEFLPIRLDRVYSIVDPACAFLVGLILRNSTFLASGSGSWAPQSAGR